MSKTKADPAVAELAQLLAAPAAKAEFLAVLPEAARNQLVADIERARKAHSQHIRERMTEALNHLPWLLRGPVKKLFGK